MDKSRQQFEEEFRKHTTLDKDDIFEMDYESDDYYYLATRQAWFWWQASRESLINSLETVGYMESNGVDYINKHGFTHINAEQSGSINIPLYKLD
ncbi:hypothetical protein [Providencia rettgeri]|uniref:hypothetical protein n=1 Tax=Providencia rettgeri TaxID=587 RepID=UPI00384B8638